MTLWLLDTNVLSELRRPKPDKTVLSFVGTQRLESLHVSIVTIAEIRYGIDIHPNVAKRAEIETWLAGTIRPMFRGRILPISEDVMLAWRILVGRDRKRNQAVEQPDLLIAATAQHHAMTVVTRDVRGFVSTGVPLFNPWSSQSQA